MIAAHTWHRVSRARAMLIALSLGAVPASAHAQATLTGHVNATGQPLVDARVIVRGTSLTAVTNSQGQYTIRNVPSGTQTVEALRVGYRAMTATVALAGTETK